MFREKDVWWPTSRLDKELGFLSSQSIDVPPPSNTGHQTPRPLPSPPPEGIRVSPEVGELFKVPNSNSKPGNHLFCTSGYALEASSGA